ncbi:MAG TPA: aminotransferase class I/II-fold pyridoxal phosphate-dependent enzyme [Xanthobacteraceae bacterium]|nr:aminotransferase class I/II-fold pyridoxal phosphate-dependent enzyme [Xanthobacteraceae bacterium]
MNTADSASQFSRFTDFTTLPGYSELKLQRGAAEVAGIGNPFFRTHDRRAGARTWIDGRELVNFASYDYLGLNGHPEVMAAARAAIDHYGLSSSASRLVAGERPAHRRLESALADLYDAEDCAVFVSGYMTNLGVIGHLLGPKDLFVYDAAIHNSAMIGGVLSGATRRSFPHNDMAALDQLLASMRHRYERVLIAVEGLYSMDGDVPDLPALIEIKKRHGAWLMVDEAHALGVLGARGRGIHEHFGANAHDVDIWMGTLSKTLAGCGGYIAGSGELTDYLKLTVGAFVYSVGLPPAWAEGCAKAIEIMKREPERVRRLQDNALLFKRLAGEAGLDIAQATGAAVVPVLVGNSIAAVMLSERLFARGFNVLPIIHPAVAPNAARLRFFLTSEHTEEDIRVAVQATAEEVTNLSGASSLIDKVEGR